MCRSILVFLMLTLSASALAVKETAVIRMEAIAGLKYNLRRFDVKPGQEVELHLSNKDTMLHNLVITRPGKRSAVVDEALALGAKGPKMDFIPNSDDVLWAIPVVEQKKTRVIRFKAPMELGDYPFVCTFPGHGTVMFGSMVVRKSPRKPLRSKGTQPSSTKTQFSEQPLKVPGVKRLFMQDSGPASIAVVLPDNYAYTWDAGSVGLRYVWKGGFIKDIEQWPAGRAKTTVQVDGDIIYREELFSVRIGKSDVNQVPTYQFKGYTLDEKGYPHFYYHVNGTKVSEFIQVRDNVIERRFQVFGPGELSLRPSLESQQKITVRELPKPGKGDFLNRDISPEREFIVTIDLGDKS